MRSLFFLFGSLILLISGVLAFSDEQDDLKAAIRELEALGSLLQQFQSEHSELETKMRNQEVELSKLHREIYDTDRSIGLGEVRLNQLSEEKAELDSLRQTQEESLRADLVAMYKTGSEEPIKILLNQEDPAKLSRMLIYYRYLLGARTKKINSYTETTEKIAANKAGLNRQNTRLDRLRTELKRQESQLNASLARRARLLERLASRILTTEQQIAARKENARHLERLIKEAAERIAKLAPPENYRPFVELKGQYPWPVSGKVEHRFGSPRTGDLRWQGVVLKSVSGQEVHSIHHGRVVFADYMRGYGLLVIVDHEGGYMTLYGHNQSLFVQPGDWVTAGDQLALVGNTGGLSETGLYFEVRQNGRPVNPSSWCTRSLSGSTVRSSRKNSVRSDRLPGASEQAVNGQYREHL